MIRPERPEDHVAIRAVNLAAFPSEREAGIVDALRADHDAWITDLSLVATDETGRVVAHALFSRCRVGGEPALVLGPCAVLPEVQRRGAGSATIRTGLEAARARGEKLVVVLGYPGYYPRFGFVAASRWGIHPAFDGPDEVVMSLPIVPGRPVPSGLIEYPPAFGV